MPAAKKSSNKKSNKRFSIGSWSRRKQTVVTVLVFAVIGGGWLVYKSFAASVLATYPATSIVRVSGNATEIQDANSGSKSGNTVWKLPWGANADAIIWATGGTVTVPANSQWQYCASIKGVGSAWINGPYDPIIGLTNNTAYQTYCAIIHKTGAASQVVKPASISNSGNSDIYVSNETIQLVSSGTSAPAK